MFIGKLSCVSMSKSEGRKKKLPQSISFLDYGSKGRANPKAMLIVAERQKVFQKVQKVLPKIQKVLGASAYRFDQLFCQQYGATLGTQLAPSVDGIFHILVVADGSLHRPRRTLHHALRKGERLDAALKVGHRLRQPQVIATHAVDHRPRTLRPEKGLRSLHGTGHPLCIERCMRPPLLGRGMG